MTFKTYAAARIAAACALTLAACATAPGGRHAASPGPDPQLEAKAQAFESFMRRGRSISPEFSGPSEVSDALAAGASYEPVALESGMIAYAALAALQEPRFVASVRATARGRGGPDLARRLAIQPDSIGDLPGARAAEARASAALSRQGEALASGGKAVKAASYGIQRQAWAKAKVADPQARLARVKQIGGIGPRPSGAVLYRTAAAGPVGGGTGSPVVRRGVALAALSLLGSRDRAGSLTTEPKSAMCLRLAKLNFHQCLASAGPYYEDIYCLGQHAMIDPGRCVTEAAVR